MGFFVFYGVFSVVVCILVCETGGVGFDSHKTPQMACSYRGKYAGLSIQSQGFESPTSRQFLYFLSSMDRAIGYEPIGWGFKSSRKCQWLVHIMVIMPVCLTGHRSSILLRVASLFSSVD